MMGRVRNLFPFWSANVPDSAVVFEIERDNLYALADRDKAQRQADALAVEVEQYKVRLAEVEEQRDAMARDLIVLAHRRNDLRRMLAASPDQAYRNCLALTDRNAELRRDLNDLEKRYAELQKDVGLS